MKRMMLVLITILGTAFLLNLCSCSPKATEIPSVIRPIVTMKVESPGSGRERTFSGVAKAELETGLSFRVDGEIDQLPAKIGMKVAVGDLIARLDPTDYQLAVKQLDAQLAQTQAQLKQARAEYERTRSLYEAGNVSKSDLDRLQALFESASAQRDAIQESLELARARVEYCSILAPVSGAISSVLVERHQTVKAGQVIATFSSNKELVMELGIPESLISQFHVGDMAEVSFESCPNKSFKAIVSEVGVATTQATTYPLKLQLQERDPQIRAGMVGEAKFSLTASIGESYITIPPVAVVGSPSGEHYIWIYAPESGSVNRRTIEIGALTSSGLQIISGLEPNEVIVIRGVHRLEEGMKVRLMEEK